MVCLITPWMTRNLDTFNKNLGIMNEIKDKHPEDFKVEVLSDSIKFYLPRVEGYLEVVRDMASKYRGMSLIEFDGYFEGKFEPVKYIRARSEERRVGKECRCRWATYQ